MTKTTIKTVDTGSGERALATEDIGGGEVALTTDAGTTLADGFAVTNLVAENSPLAGGDMGFIATIKNTTSSSDTQDVTLEIDGVDEETRTLSISGGESVDEPFRWTDAGAAAAGLYTATVATADDAESITVAIVDKPFEIRDGGNKGTVMEFIAAVSVFDNQEDTAVSNVVTSLDGIDTLIFTPLFATAGTPAFDDIEDGDRRLKLHTPGNSASPFAQSYFDAGGTQLGGMPEGQEQELNVTSISTDFLIRADDGLATIS